MREGEDGKDEEEKNRRMRFFWSHGGIAQIIGDVANTFKFWYRQL